MSRNTKAVINLEAIRANYRLACETAPESQSIAVIKANAYGHGVIPVAQALDQIAPAFAVAAIEEGLELRSTFSEKPILILQGIQSAEDLLLASKHNLSLMIQSQAQLELLQQNTPSKPISVWLKADTGMHRLGFPIAEIKPALNKLEALPYVQQQLTICSHFACASDPSATLNQQQLDHFNALKTSLGTSLGTGIKYSFANSAAILSNPDSHCDWNRPGIMLYGGAPFDDIKHGSAKQLKPAMTLTTEVIAIRNITEGETVGYGATWKATRPSVIATLAIGYADGYSRHTPAGTPVAINNQIASLVGRVSMDMITVDITDLDKVKIGDTAELWGEQVSINTVAELSGTISYELMTSISKRVPRFYIN